SASHDRLAGAGQTSGAEARKAVEFGTAADSADVVAATRPDGAVTSSGHQGPGSRGESRNIRQNRNARLAHAARRRLRLRLLARARRSPGGPAMHPPPEAGREGVSSTLVP